MTCRTCKDETRGDECGAKKAGDECRCCGMVILAIVDEEEVYLEEIEEVEDQNRE